MQKLSSYLFLMLQYLLPKHLLTALLYRISRIRTVAIKDKIILAFANAFDVDIEEAARTVPDEYANFNDFFTRDLKPGSRPIDADANAIVSPVDGTVSSIGVIENKQILQAKGLQYTLDDLLATDLDDTKIYANGSFVTIYLAPYNYHRVHCPIDAQLVAARYVPGDLFSVNNATVSLLPRLFARNERLICHFQTTAGPMILIFVGALNVGSISTTWSGLIRPRKRGVVEDLSLPRSRIAEQVAKGSLLGWFNMGSTVIVLLPPGHCVWHDTIRNGTVLRMGESLGVFKGR